MSILLSIVMPTKGRAHAAFNNAKAILRIPGDDFEVVIRDCSETDALGAQLQALNDPRVVYEWSAPVSMTDNWNAAMLLTSGRFICYLGDDDGFFPWTLDLLREHAEDANLHCIASNPYKAVYNWSDYTIAEQASYLWFERFECVSSLKTASGKQVLTDYLNGRVPDPHVVPMPGVYHRIASRQLMERIREVSGEYFSTLIPDYYTYFVASLLTDAYYIVDVPMTFAGSCGGSNSAQYTKDRRTYYRHFEEFSDGSERISHLNYVAGNIGGILDTMEGVLSKLGSEKCKRLFSSRLAPLYYGLALCDMPGRRLELGKAALAFCIQGNRGLRGRLTALWSIQSSMFGFVRKHLDYKLRKYKLYTSSYDKSLLWYRNVRSIADATDIMVAERAGRSAGTLGQRVRPRDFYVN